MKTEVIPDSMEVLYGTSLKGGDLLDLSLGDGLASYQLVGGVMAYQGL